jgi:hypothetical protein
MKHARFVSLVSIVLVACGGAAESAKPASSPATSSPATTAATAPANATAAATATAPSTASATTTTTTTTTTTQPSPSPNSDPTAPPAGSAKVVPAKITARHVLIQWMGCQSTSSSVVRTREQALVVAKDVLRRARNGEDFARLAIEFSDEPNAGARGGSLGRFGRGAMVKQFEDAAFALKPGEISDVVESPFGFHVIQRTE